MAARKKTRRSSAKKATRKSGAAKTTPRKVARSKAAKTRKVRAGKGSPQAGDVVYSDLRKIALARALARR
jgi:hypothetical protein